MKRIADDKMGRQKKPRQSQKTKLLMSLAVCPIERMVMYKPPRFYRMMPNSDARYTYTKLFSNFINGADFDGLKKLFLRKYCTPDVIAVHMYDGEQNPFGPNKRETIGPDAIAAVAESIVKSAPDYLFEIFSTVAHFDPNTGCSFISSTYSSTFTTVFELNENNRPVYSHLIKQPSVVVKSEPVSTTQIKIEQPTIETLSNDAYNNHMFFDTLPPCESSLLGLAEPGEPCVLLRTMSNDIFSYENMLKEDHSKEENDHSVATPTQELFSCNNMIDSNKTHVVSPMPVIADQSLSTPKAHIIRQKITTGPKSVDADKQFGNAVSAGAVYSQNDAVGLTVSNGCNPEVKNRQKIRLSGRFSMDLDSDRRVTKLIFLFKHVTD